MAKATAGKKGPARGKKKTTSGRKKAAPGRKRAASGGKKASPPKSKLDQAIEEAARSAQESVAGYTKLAKEAGAQLNGNEPADAGVWLQLMAKASAQAASDAARAWTTGFEVLQALADEAEPPASRRSRKSPSKRK